MAGVYLHIPFCRAACHYCDFHFSTDTRYVHRMVECLKKEIQIRQELPKQSPVSTIYFGGGTPSVLSPQQLDEILTLLREKYLLDPNAEITLEANPEDLSDAYLEAISKLGINRLSIGIQSFFDEHLLWMNRAHTGDQATKAVQSARGAGFNNITIDLIYGFEKLTDEQWNQNLDALKVLDIDHFSAYCLTIEEGTVFGNWYKKGKVRISDEKGERHFKMLQAFALQNKYEQYEVSNFCRDGKYSRHNSAYWEGIPYLGIGPGAHSFFENKRSWNISNNALYMKAIEDGSGFSEEEILSSENRFNEKVLLGLRKASGLSVSNFKTGEWEKLVSGSRKHLDYLIVDERNIRLSPEGMLFADRIAADLFI